MREGGPGPKEPANPRDMARPISLSFEPCGAALLGRCWSCRKVRSGTSLQKGGRGGQVETAARFTCALWRARTRRRARARRARSARAFAPRARSLAGGRATRALAPQRRRRAVNAALDEKSVSTERSGFRARQKRRDLRVPFQSLSPPVRRRSHARSRAWHAQLYAGLCVSTLALLRHVGAAQGGMT